MGVKGLWQILEAEGVLNNCSADISTLKGKVLAVDVSIWLYQFIKSVPADKDLVLSPLVIGGLFQRVCKLLHFGIKPIFVFDGVAPSLKKDTIAERRSLREKGDIDYSKLAKKILKNKLKLMALEEVSTASAENNDENSFKLFKPELSEIKVPPIDFLNFLESPNDSDADDNDLDHNEMDYDYLKYNVNGIDSCSKEFKKLPYDIQEQILLESRKRTIDSSQIFEASGEQKQKQKSQETSPKKIDNALDFSKAQVEALIKRRKLMNELEMLRGNSVNKTLDSKSISQGKIASSSDKKYIFAKNAQAGWTLSLTESNETDESINQNDHGINSKLKKKNNSNEISDIEDDDEFMKMMFGSSNEKLEILSEPEIESLKTKSKSENENDIAQSTQKINLISNLSSVVKELNTKCDAIKDNISDTEIEIENEFDLNIKKNPILTSDSDYEFIIPHKLKIKNENEEKDIHKLPDMILEGLINNKLASAFGSGSEAENFGITFDNAKHEPVKTIYSEEEETFTDLELDEEYESFIKEVSEKIIPGTDKSTNYKEIIDKLQAELREFDTLSEASILSSVSPTKILIEAFMEMLHRFNLPFIAAPFEAEAQCTAILGIDGIISDDSDCLLFGAQVVYKGFFTGSKGKNRNKGKANSAQIIKISMEEIFKVTGLRRNDLIILAHLLGCDYCTGIDGIGPKRALEIVKLTKDQEEPIDALRTIADLSEEKGGKCQKYQNWLKGKLPSNFVQNRIIEAFLNPIVTPLKVNDLTWGCIDQSSMEQFMTINAKWPKEKTQRFLRDIQKKNK